MKGVAKKASSRSAVDGVLLLDKPFGLSSNQALQQAKRLLNASKAGHAGTLDPAATGLLVVCLGEATKLAGMGLEDNKTYEACIELGSATDSGDAQGQVIARRPFLGTDADIDVALARHRGPLSQVPPMVSALKRDGKPLYEYARAGIEVEREARAITIHSLDLLRREGHHLWVRVHCSKGTYIRVLAEQIGAALDTCAHLTALRRTGAGDLSLRDALTLEALEALPPQLRAGVLKPPEILINTIPYIAITEAEEKSIRLGQALPRPLVTPGLQRLHGVDGHLVGLAEGRDGAIHPRRLLLSRRNVMTTLNLSLEEQDDSPIQ